MSKYQYLGEGHTLIQTAKAVKDKVKVVQGEIVEVEEGIFSDGRLMLAGFQKIVDGVEDIVDGATNIITDIVGGNDADTTEDTTTTTTATVEDVGTPTVETIKDAVENTEENTETAPEVETTVVEDGKDEVKVTVEAPKFNRAEIVAELKALGVEFKDVGTKTVDLAELLEASKAQ